MKRTIFLKSLLLAIFVCVIGFGVMNMLWIQYEGDNGLPGFYDYNAATIGDGLCLPILIFASAYYCMTHRLKIEKSQRKAHVISIIVSLFFACIGFAIQISWLLDDNIVLNWTIPKAHYFNVAGWYHCFYFTMMFGIIAYGISKMFLLRRYGELKAHFCDEIIFFLFSFGGTLYIILQRMDDYSDEYSYLSIATTVTILILCIISVYLFTSNKTYFKQEIVYCLSGVSAAYGAALTIAQPNYKFEIYAVIMLLLSFSYIFQLNADFKRYISSIVLIAVPILFMNMAILSTSFCIGLSLLIILLFTVPIANVYIRKICNKDTNDWNKVFVHCKYGILYQLVIFASAILLNYNVEIDDKISVIDFLFNTLLIALVHYNIVDIFCELTEAEDSRYDTENGFEKMSKTRTLVYFQVAMICGGAAIYLFLTLIRFVEFQSIEIFFSLEDKNILLISVCTIIAILCTCLVGSFFKNKNINNLVISIFFAMVYLSIDIAMFFIKVPFSANVSVIHLCVLFQAIGVSLLVAESFFSNIYRIRGVNYRISYLINSIIIFVGSSVMLLFTVFPAMGDTMEASKALTYVFIGIVGDIFVLIILPCVIFSVTKPDYHTIQVAPEKGLGEIAKNGFLGVMITVLAGAVPIYIYTINTSWIKIILAIVTLIGTIYWAVSFCLVNNVTHLTKREEEIIKKEMNENEKDYLARKQLLELEKHLKAQNICALIALLLYCLLPLAIEEFENVGKKTKKSIKDKYIPKLKIIK